MKSVSTLRRLVWDSMDEWSDLSDHGPCWPISRALADAGLGRVEYCKTYCKTEHRWYGHYVVRRHDGSILDCSGEHIYQGCPQRTPRYKDFIVYDEPTHSSYTRAEVKFWKRRLL